MTTPRDDPASARRPGKRPGHLARRARQAAVAAAAALALAAVLALWWQPRLVMDITQNLIALCT